MNTRTTISNVGMIEDVVASYREVPPRDEYSLSELGESMRPIINSMESWGLAHQEKVRNEH